MTTVPPEVEGRLVVSYRYDRYKERNIDYIKEQAKRRLGEQLVEALHSPGVGQIFTVMVSDGEIKFANMTSEYSLWADIVRVEEVPLPIMTPRYYSSMGNAELSVSAFEEIKRRIRRKVKRIFSRK